MLDKKRNDRDTYSVHVIWESQLYISAIPLPSKFRFINRYILETRFSRYYNFTPFGRLNHIRLTELFIYECYSHSKVNLLGIKESSLADALAFCAWNGLKNDKIKNTIQQYIAENHLIDENDLFKYTEFERIKVAINSVPHFGVPKNYRAVGTQLLQDKLIPVRNSPLRAESLLNLIKKSGYIGLGAYIGYLVIEPSPMLFITMPVGMVIFGAASGVAHGLEERLKRLMS